MLFLSLSIKLYTLQSSEFGLGLIDSIKITMLPIKNVTNVFFLSSDMRKMYVVGSCDGNDAVALNKFTVFIDTVRVRSYLAYMINTNTIVTVLDIAAHCYEFGAHVFVSECTEVGLIPTKSK